MTAPPPHGRPVPARARELAAALAERFERDQALVVGLGDAQRRLEHANGRLWSGLHPDAIALLYDNADRVAIREGASVIAGIIVDALRNGYDEQQVVTAVLPVLQQAHWAVHRAFLDYRHASEERRQLAVEVGELAWQLTDALTAAGWTPQAARSANVHELAVGDC